ncbi:MAG: hypothetical protein ABEH40_02930 [Haloferacaceae archaeon]
MRRRALLAAAVSPLAGCSSILGRDGSDGGGRRTDGSTATAAPGNGTPTDPSAATAAETDTRRYEECPREIVRYERFPPEIRTEIDGALDGRYAADRVFLDEAMDVRNSYVAVDGEFYDPSVTAESGGEVLRLRRVEPKAFPQPRPVSVESRRNGERTVTVELVADDGTVLLDGTRSLRPGGEVEFGRTRRAGTHELRVTVENDTGTTDTATRSVRIDRARRTVLVVLEPDGVALAGAVATLPACRFDR